jgi:hypothetical protein
MASAREALTQPTRHGNFVKKRRPAKAEVAMHARVIAAAATNRIEQCISVR